MRGQSAEMQRAPRELALAVFVHGFQICNAAEVHYMLGSRQAQLHQRNETHPARQHLGVAFGDQRQSFFQTGWRRIFEILRDHAWPP